MRFFHPTTKEAAEQILREGFRDRTGYYGFSGMEITWTWLSHVPVDSNEGAKGDVLLVVDLNVLENEIADFEVQDTERCYREWAIPAPLINSRGSARIATESEEDEGYQERWRRAERVLADEETAGPVQN